MEAAPREQTGGTLPRDDGSTENESWRVRCGAESQDMRLESRARCAKLKQRRPASGALLGSYWAGPSAAFLSRAGCWPKPREIARAARKHSLSDGRGSHEDEVRNVWGHVPTSSGCHSGHARCGLGLPGRGLGGMQSSAPHSCSAELTQKEQSVHARPTHRLNTGILCVGLANKPTLPQFPMPKWKCFHGSHTITPPLAISQ